MASSVTIEIQFNGKYITIPINPEEIKIEQSADNDEIEILGKGAAVRRGNIGLRKLTIESFFPAEGSYFYTNIKPSTCVEFIKSIWESDNTNNIVPKIVTTGLPINLGMYFVIESFNYDHKAGEEDDIYYELEIKEYKAYGAKLITKSTSGTKSSRSATSKKSNSTNYYIVKKGDCLWNITKAYTGNGSRWKELYNVNTKVIGKNPNLIYPGQKLTLPSGWGSSTKTTSKTTTSKKTTSKSTSKKTSTKNKSTNNDKNAMATAKFKELKNTISDYIASAKKAAKSTSEFNTYMLNGIEAAQRRYNNKKISKNQLSTLVNMLSSAKYTGSSVTVGGGGSSF